MKRFIFLTSVVFIASCQRTESSLNEAKENSHFVSYENKEALLTSVGNYSFNYKNKMIYGIRK